MIRRPPRSTQSRSSAASDVYKRQAVARLVFAQLGRVDEEDILEPQEIVLGGAGRREAKGPLVVDGECERMVLGPEVIAELVAQVLGGIALREHGGRSVTVNRAMVGGDQNRHAHADGLPDGCESLGALEPLPRKCAECF